MPPDVIIGINVLKKGEFHGRIAVISDDHVIAAQGDYLKSVLPEHRTFMIPAGEPSKSREMKATLEDQLCEAGYGRDTLIVAFGGGVVLDLAGFLASTYCRGVPVIYCATSLLAMVDAAIGGKTAVNTPYGKNLIGTFYEPTAVYLDLSTLSTLPEDDYISALSEVIKTAMIYDANLLKYLEESVDAILTRDPEVIYHIVERCVAIKTEVVTIDYHETGLRAILNYGHTIGHAIENASNYHISHGNAVAYGLQFETELMVQLGHLTQEVKARLMSLLTSLRLPTTLPLNLSIDAIMNAMQHDKKNREKNIKMVMLTDIGIPLTKNGQYTHTIEPLLIRNAIACTSQ